MYPWMVGDAMEPVRRPFNPDDLAPGLAPSAPRAVANRPGTVESEWITKILTEPFRPRVGLAERCRSDSVMDGGMTAR